MAVAVVIGLVAMGMGWSFWPALLLAISAAALSWWAQETDADGDYTIIGGTETEVCVAARGATAVQRFVVSGEMVPTYRAQLLPK